MLTWTMRSTPAFLAAVEQDERIAHGVGVLEEAMVESHPIGVVEDRHALEVFGQPVRPVEIEGERPDAVAKGICPRQRVGERDDRVPLRGEGRWAMYFPE